MIRSLLTTLTFGLLLLTSMAQGQVTVAPWPVSAKPTRDAVRAVVEAQLGALQQRDFRRAHGLAAVALKRQFTLPLFTAMLERGYQPLLEHRSAELGLVRDDRAGNARVSVTVTPKTGRVLRYTYFLVLEGADWRVGGVVRETETPRADA